MKANKITITERKNRTFQIVVRHHNEEWESTERVSTVPDALRAAASIWQQRSNKPKNAWEMFCDGVGAE